MVAGPTEDHSDRYNYLDYKSTILQYIKIPKYQGVALNISLIAILESFQMQNTMVRIRHTICISLGLHLLVGVYICRPTSTHVGPMHVCLYQRSHTATATNL